MYVILEIARKKKEYVTVVFLNYCIYITTVNKMLVAPGIRL